MLILRHLIRWVIDVLVLKFPLYALKYLFEFWTLKVLFSLLNSIPLNIFRNQLAFDWLKESIPEFVRFNFTTAVNINELLSYDISYLLVLQVELSFNEFEIILYLIFLKNQTPFLTNFLLSRVFNF